MALLATNHFFLCLLADESFRPLVQRVVDGGLRSRANRISSANRPPQPSGFRSAVRAPLVPGYIGRGGLVVKGGKAGIDHRTGLPNVAHPRSCSSAPCP